MAKRRFTLGDSLNDFAVSIMDTAQEQIEYIDLDRIDPDPDNFYSLEGLDELAANIELVGLQQPLRVRPTPSVGSADSSPSGGAKGDRFTVVSGHRRRAACLLIRDGGSKMFEHGVPCIVERGNTSKEMQELRLIYANSATRVMTSAELSRQAERVEELLYKLKEQGVEFPGRMRDHVAAAVNASKTKLARLHAIRGKLAPEILSEFDSGTISEAVAYRISQEDAVIQADLAEYPRAALRGLSEKTVDGMIGTIKARRKPVGADAPGGPKPTLHKAYVDNDGLKNYLEERAEEDEKYFEMLSDVAGVFLPCIGGVPSRREGIEALKSHHGVTYHGGSSSGKFCWFFEAKPKGLELEPKRGPKILRTWTEVYDLLCTIAVARLLSKDYDGPPMASAPTEVSPTWKTGTPTRDGRYFCKLTYSKGGEVQEVKLDYEQRPDGDPTSPWIFFGSPLTGFAQVIGWWPLPEKEVTV